MYHRIKRRECLLIDNSYQFYSDMGNLKYRAFKFWKMNGNKLEGKFLLSCLGLMAKLCLKPYMGGTLTIHGGRMRKLRPCLFFVLFFLISHYFLKSIISCIFKNKIVSRKWISELVGFKLSYIEIIGFFLAEHWDQLVGIIYWLYFLLMNLTSNSIQILNAGCQANPWKSDFKLSLEWKSVCIAQFWEKREP